MTILKDVFRTLRTAYAMVKETDASSEDDCTKALAQWTTYGDHMLIHLEGVKGMKSGVKGIKSGMKGYDH